MGVIDNVAQRTYYMPTSTNQGAGVVGQGFQVNGSANVGVGTPSAGFAMTLLVVLGGVLLAYAVTRRIQGA